jgi:drug/metabolite transporter (DMT)-like permease
MMAIISAALFGASSPAAKLLEKQFLPFQLAGLLYLGAAIAMLPGLMLSRKLTLPWHLASGSRWRLLAALTFGGLLAPLLLMSALRLSSASFVSMWLSLEMVLTVVLARVFFREHIGPNGWLGVLGATVAAALLCLGEQSATVQAAVLVFGACLCWALDNNCTAILDALTPSEITFYKGVVAGSINLSIGMQLAPLNSSGSFLPIALAVGATCYGISLLLYIRSAQKLGASRSQLIFASAPFWGVALSALVLHEPITTLQMLCAAIFAGSLSLIFAGQHSHRHTHAAIEHVHEHTHDDGHHTHTHEGQPASLKHSHWHKHDPLTHAHAHLPDLHHRHDHEEGDQ